MTHKFLSLLLVLGASFTVHAQVTLPPLIAPDVAPLVIDPLAPAIPCAEILDHMDKYGKMIVDHNQSLTGFLDQITNKVGEWYSLLSPLEDTTQKLTVGTFSVLQEGGDSIANISRMADDNSSLLASEYANILSSLKTCKIMEK